MDSIFERDCFEEILSQEPPTRAGVMVLLAAGFAARELRTRRRDAIVRSFAKVPGEYAARPHDFEAFRNGWIAEYRALGGDCAEPETFFNKTIAACGCAQCAAQHAA